MSLTTLHPNWQLSADEILFRANHGGRAQETARVADAMTGDLTRAIPAIATLPAKQRLVVRLVAEGLGNGEIAARLGINDQTVKNHLTLAYRQLGLAEGAGSPRMAISYAVGYADGMAARRAMAKH